MALHGSPAPASAPSRVDVRVDDDDAALLLDKAAFGAADAKPRAASSALFFIAANIATSIALVLVNKLIFGTFPWPLLLTLGHQAVCWAVTAAMARAGVLAVPSLPRRDTALVGAAFVLGIFLFNLSLQLNSVAVFQLSKMACLPCIVLLQRILYRAPTPSRPVLVSLGILLVGVFLGTEHQFAVNPLGLLAAVSAVLFTSLAQVSLQHMPSMKGISGMQSVAVLSPSATLVSGMLVLVVELPRWLLSPPSASKVAAPVPIALIAVSCILAVAANFVGNSLIQKTSALTYQVVGHLKSMLIIVLGTLFFVTEPSPFSPLKIAGILLSLLGMCSYTLFKMNPEINSFGSIKGAISNSMADNPFMWIRGLIMSTFMFATLSCFAIFGASSPTIPVPSTPPAPQLSQTSVADLATSLWDAYDTNNTAQFKWDRRREIPVVGPKNVTTWVKTSSSKPRVLVMSADSRPLTPLSEVENQDPGNLPYITMSAIYNQWWAIRHGYDYRRVDINAPEGWHATWAKVKAMYDMIHKYDYVIFLDGDAFVNDPSINLDFMIERWGFHPEASFMMAREPEGQSWPNNQPNDDAVNTGVVVIRATDQAKRVLKAMHDCPSHRDKCDIWRQHFAHEQTVFNKMMRGTVLRPKDLVVIPCADANGWWADPRPNEAKCKGRFITHAWGGKHLVSRRMKDIMAREHVKLYERLLRQGYHVTKCTPWQENVDERCLEPLE